MGLKGECAGEACMGVLGGRNDYAISVADESGDWLQYCDPSHTGGPSHRLSTTWSEPYLSWLCYPASPTTGRWRSTSAGICRPLAD
jgi:hypothetical protein